MEKLLIFMDNPNIWYKYTDVINRPLNLLNFTENLNQLFHFPNWKLQVINFNSVLEDVHSFSLEMATLRNKKTLATAGRDSQEEHLRNKSSQMFPESMRNISTGPLTLWI